LTKLAQQACKEHGKTLHINEVHYHHEESSEKEKDFFADIENEGMFGAETSAAETNRSVKVKDYKFYETLRIKKTFHF
jgi:hypothetical protein